MRFVWLLLVLPLGGCALVDSGPTYAEQLNQFVGRPEVDVVSALGAPNQTYESGGKKFLTWSTVRSRVVPGPYYPGFYGGGYGRRGVGMGYSSLWAPDQVVVDSCNTTAVVQNGRVQGFTLNGTCR